MLILRFFVILYENHSLQTNDSHKMMYSCFEIMADAFSQLINNPSLCSIIFHPFRFMLYFEITSLLTSTESPSASQKVMARISTSLRSGSHSSPI